MLDAIKAAWSRWRRSGPSFIGSTLRKWHCRKSKFFSKNRAKFQQTVFDPMYDPGWGAL
ncbi:hypothetical protein [Methylorubrum zatmanii]|uniref:Uncharacterized protein n=1 Tax=Methylorubrum zatmanii TaxID=29429 RepID=A0ABW1WNX2_9HYPH|nr:hypothetical protein [Methylorubrum zatmanii]